MKQFNTGILYPAWYSTPQVVGYLNKKSILILGFIIFVMVTPSNWPEHFLDTYKCKWCCISRMYLLKVFRDCKNIKWLCFMYIWKVATYPNLQGGGCASSLGTDYTRLNKLHISCCSLWNFWFYVWSHYCMKKTN